MKRFPDLVANETTKHVQNLVPLVAFLEQPHRGIPHLRRRVIPQLSRDDLMHSEMQTWVHRPVDALNLAPPLFERLLELGMLVTDHERAHARIGQLLDLDANRGERMRVGDEAPSLVLAVSMRLRRHREIVAHAAGGTFNNTALCRSRPSASALDGPALTVPWHFDEGEALVAATAEQGLEGVVAKRLDAAYRKGAHARGSSTSTGSTSAWR